jgi:hypothetical protein
MALTIRRTVVISSERREEAGIQAASPLRKLAIIAVVENPWAGRYAPDLSEGMESSVALGQEMASMARRFIAPGEAQSYGKGGIVGLAGEQEHANALLTTAYANPLRDAIGGAAAWISSMTKVGGPGTLIDIPMNHKDDVYVRSHYDGMSLVLPDSPMPDEIAVIFCLATGGRLNARVGGLTHEEVVVRKSRPQSAS